MQTNYANSPKKEKKKGCMIAILVIIGLGIIGALLPEPKEPTSSKTDESIEAIAEEGPVEFEIDTVKMRELAPKFREEKDEFKGITWIYPKTATHYINTNDIYTYFDLRDGKPENFRLKIQYAADDWLFIQKYTFLIDGTRYDYTPRKVERDNDSQIWEWSDESMDESKELPLILAALLNAKEVKIRFEGRQYHKDKTLTQKQIKQIVEPFYYYSSMIPKQKK